jgi:tRNA(fMet)-specific endonuclease VapC
LAEEIQRLTFVDSSVLIEYFRKSKKENSFFYTLLNKNFQGFAASVVVHFEIYKGANNMQMIYWNNLFEDILIVPYNQSINKKSLSIYQQLKKARKSIEFQDLIIAAKTALFSNCPLATINKKHFENIEGIELITPADL